MTNLIVLMFYFYTCAVTLLGISININVPYSTFVSSWYKYGKLLSNKFKNQFKDSPFLIPKRWFLHFYVSAAIMSLLCWNLIWYIVAGKNAVPDVVMRLLNFLTSSARQPAVNEEVSYAVLLLYSLHVWKRLFETLFVSVFSSNKINVVHYIMGHTHYIGAFIGLISLFPSFTLSSYNGNSSVDKFSAWEYFCSFIVIGASVFQFHSLKILADLRKRSKAKNKKEEYFFPEGGLFALVSCPHMFTEIVVYLGLAALMRFQHSTWNAVAIFVLANQVQVGYLNHDWYKKEFKNYPLNRKAILPFLL